MGNVKLSGDNTVSVTAISNIFIDEYMPEANGEFVKVYLYLLRAMANDDSDCSISAMADRFDHVDKDIIRALNYWDRQNVIRLEYDSNRDICGITLLPLTSKEDYSALAAISPAPATPAATAPAATAPAATAPAANASTVSAPVITGEVRREYSPSEIDAFRQNPEISELFYVIEAYTRKPLTFASINTVLYWYEDLGFSTELIDYLVEYCANKGHLSFRYMDRIALDWHSQNIFTVEAAKADTESHNKANYTVIKAMGIVGRDLAKTEKAKIARWTDELKFELPLIEEACRRTIDATHQPSFGYADKILESWFENKVRNMDDIQKLDEAFSSQRKISIQTTEPPKRNKFSNFDARNNNYDQLEQLLAGSSSAQ